MPEPAAAGLSVRQLEVAIGISRGLTNKQIARSLGLSDHTTRRHREKLMKVLGVTSAEAVSRLVAIGGLSSSEKFEGVEKTHSADKLTSTANLSRLTQRERTVALLIAGGANSREVALTLGVTHATARTHRQRILEKLGIQRATQIAALVVADSHGDSMCDT